MRRGLPPGRIQAEGRGASQPVADNRSPEGQARNRRVEIEVVGSWLRQLAMQRELSMQREPPVAACPTGQMARFPWPDPPQPTVADTLSRAWLLGAGLAKTATMRGVSDRLESAVRAAGDLNPKLLGVGCDGFAMVLDLARIDDDGARAHPRNLERDHQGGGLPAAGCLRHRAGDRDALQDRRVIALS